MTRDRIERRCRDLFDLSNDSTFLHKAECLVIFNDDLVVKIYFNRSQGCFHRELQWLRREPGMTASDVTFNDVGKTFYSIEMTRIPEALNLSRKFLLGHDVAASLVEALNSWKSRSIELPKGPTSKRSELADAVMQNISRQEVAQHLEEPVKASLMHARRIVADWNERDPKQLVNTSIHGNLFSSSIFTFLADITIIDPACDRLALMFPIEFETVPIAVDACLIGGLTVANVVQYHSFNDRFDEGMFLVTFLVKTLARTRHARHEVALSGGTTRERESDARLLARAPEILNEVADRISSWAV